MSRPRISRVAHKGLTILTVLTALIGTVASVSLISNLLALPDKTNWRSLGFAVADFIALRQVWYGDRLHRYLSAGYFTIKGVMWLVLVALLGTVLFAATPPEHQRAGFEIIATVVFPVLLPYLAIAFLYLAFSAVIAFVPSVRLFLEYQRITGGSLLQSIVDAVRIVPGFRRNVSDMSIAELVRPGIRQPELTRASLTAIADNDLSDAINDWLRFREMSGTIPILTPGMKMVQATALLQAEVDNGGFHQYFWNQSASAAFDAMEGYRLIGADQHVAIVLRAIEAWLREEREQESFRPAKLSELIEMYCAARIVSSLSELDSEFYKLPGTAGLTNSYIRNHPAEFATA